MHPAIFRATLLTALLAGGATPVLIPPAMADDQACHDEIAGTCCRWDDVLKRNVSTSCTQPPVAQTAKKPAAPATQATSAATAAGSATDDPAVSTSAATAASQDETTYGNPGNDRIGADGNPVGHAGETPGNNEEGSFGDGVKGRSDVAGGGGGSTDNNAGDTGAVASASGGAGATGNNGNGDGTVGNSAGKGKN